MPFCPLPFCPVTGSIRDANRGPRTPFAALISLLHRAPSICKLTFVNHSFIPDIYIAPLQENWSRKTIVFIIKIVFLETFSLWYTLKTVIFLKNFSSFFEHLPLGNFWSLLGITAPTFVFFTPA